MSHLEDGIAIAVASSDPVLACRLDDLMRLRHGWTCGEVEYRVREVAGVDWSHWRRLVEAGDSEVHDGCY